MRPLTAQLEEKHSQVVALEHQARVEAEADAATLRREYERRLGELEGAPHGAPGFGGDRQGADPPAMAAPGYRCVRWCSARPRRPPLRACLGPGDFQWVEVW